MRNLPALPSARGRGEMSMWQMRVAPRSARETEFGVLCRRPVASRVARHCLTQKPGVRPGGVSARPAQRHRHWHH
jgi:hypothetical protein